MLWEILKGSLNAIKKLSKKYKIIIFSSKVRSDRPLVNNKSGLQLVDEWLSKHGFSIIFLKLLQKSQGQIIT